MATQPAAVHIDRKASQCECSPAVSGLANHRSTSSVGHPRQTGRCRREQDRPQGAAGAVGCTRSPSMDRPRRSPDGTSPTRVADERRGDIPPLPARTRPTRAVVTKHSAQTAVRLGLQRPVVYATVSAPSISHLVRRYRGILQARFRVARIRPGGASHRPSVETPLTRAQRRGTQSGDRRHPAPSTQQMHPAGVQAGSERPPSLRRRALGGSRPGGGFGEPMTRLLRPKSWSSR